MDGFTLHGIDHSSPSSVNMWASAPCAWVAKYLYGKKFNFSLAAKAGVLVEDAVVSVLARGMSAEDAIKQAVGEYNKASMLGSSDSEQKRGAAIPAMIEMTLAELAPYGDPEFQPDVVKGFSQKKIELMCNGNGWKMPLIGFLDFHFPQHGLIVDLKTTMRLPSDISDEHRRQGSVYKQAMGNQSVRFLYVSGKGCKWHDIEDHLPVLAEVKAILNRQEAFLRMGDNDLLRSVVPVMANSYYWSDDADTRKELYGV
jgi:hypothetical protein